LGLLAKDSSSKWKRPWFTMILEPMAIFVVFTLAVYQAIYQPKGITSHVLVFADSGGNSVCEALLTPSSLRGEIVSFADTLFDSWRCVYYGCV
jgi:ABC-type sugar transport system permease subunit